MKILIVEDEERLADVVKAGLQQEGFAVDIAKDGQEGLSRIHAFHYDLIILDIMMPKVDGLAVLEGYVRDAPQQESMGEPFQPST